MGKLAETSFSLTSSPDAIYHLYNQGLGEAMKVKGRIKTKEKCPKCKGKFEHIYKMGFICNKCKTMPRRFYLDLHWSGQRIKIYSDERCHPLDSYNLSLETLFKLNAEIRDGSFDLSKYIKKTQAEYYTKVRLTQYLKKKEDKIAPSNINSFKKQINVACEFFGTKDVRDIRKLDLEQYEDFLLGKGLSAKTVKNYIDTFMAFLRYLKNDLEIVTNVPKPPHLDIRQPVFCWVTPETQAEILEEIPEGDRPIIIFLMLQGVRPSEARAIKVEDVDLENKVVFIRRTFSKNVLVPRRKGKGAPPLIQPIHPELYPILDDLLTKRKTLDRFSQTRELTGGFLFLNPRTGKPYSENGIRRIWHRVREKLGISKTVRLYDVTRHSFASNLLNRNVPISKISKLLGHTSIGTTERYSHVDVDSLRYDLGQISIIHLPDRRKEKDAHEGSL